MYTRLYMMLTVNVICLYILKHSLCIVTYTLLRAFHVYLSIHFCFLTSQNIINPVFMQTWCFTAHNLALYTRLYFLLLFICIPACTYYKNTCFYAGLCHFLLWINKVMYTYLYIRMNILCTPACTLRFRIFARSQCTPVCTWWYLAMYTYPYI